MNYEIEYIAFGHASDRENLESAVTACFTLRTILNLAYLYLSTDKDADLQRVVQGLSAAGMIPVAGEVLKLFSNDLLGFGRGGRGLCRAGRGRQSPFNEGQKYMEYVR